jgi:hypothetical protein
MLEIWREIDSNSWIPTREGSRADWSIIAPLPLLEYLGPAHINPNNSNKILETH